LKSRLGPTYMIGAGRVSSREPITSRRVSVLPDWAADTMTARRYLPPPAAIALAQGIM
jgi:hypothetical protein